MPMVAVKDLRMGHLVGTERRQLYVVSTTPEVTGCGTVKAGVIDVRRSGEGEPEFVRREWLHPTCMVHVRERAA